MGQSSEFLVCKSCGAVSARVELENCKRCGAAYKSMNLQPSDSDEFWNLLEEIESIAEEVKVESASELTWDDRHDSQTGNDSGAGTPYETDRFAAVKSTPNSNAFIEARKEAQRVENDPTPKKGLLGDVVERVLADETTVSGNAPVAKAPSSGMNGGMQIMKRRKRSRPKQSRGETESFALLASKTAHKQHRQLSRKLVEEADDSDDSLDFEIDWDAAFDSEASD